MLTDEARSGGKLDFTQKPKNMILRAATTKNNTNKLYKSVYDSKRLFKKKSNYENDFFIYYTVRLRKTLGK